MIGAILEGGYRITEVPYDGMFLVARAVAADGGRVQVTLVARAPGEAAVRALALPFDGVPKLRAVVPATADGAVCEALIEDEPSGRRVAAFTTPLPLDDVFSVGLDLARLLGRVHDAGGVFGSLRPQTTWVDRIAGRLTLTGSTPRPERYGLLGSGDDCAGSISPFFEDIFLSDVLARGEAADAGSDVAQLAMMLYRLATGRPPFQGGDGMMHALMRTIRGEVAPWELHVVDDPRAALLEKAVAAQFDPAARGERSLRALRDLLEHGEPARAR